MSRFAEQTRERIVKQLQGDPRLSGETVLAGATLTRISFFILGASGVAGFIFMLAFFGSGGLQLAIGLLLGYAAYIAFLLYVKGGPRVLGLFGVLTKRKLVLLGSSRAGVIKEWKLKQIESMELLRKGNLIVMGKLAIKPSQEEQMVFFVSNKGLGIHLVEKYQELRG
ncbi:MAG: hypothetical protein GY722_22550 [bacterium]|nr:hypothetical protein [bacterium]